MHSEAVTEQLLSSNIGSVLLPVMGSFNCQRDTKQELEQEGTSTEELLQSDWAIFFIVN